MVGRVGEYKNKLAPSYWVEWYSWYIQIIIWFFNYAIIKLISLLTYTIEVIPLFDSLS